MEIVEHKSDLLILKTPRETKKSLYFDLLFFLIIFSILIIIVLSLYIGTQSKLGIWLILVLILFIPVLHSFYNAIFKEHLKDCALSKKTGIIYFTNQSKFQKLTSTSTIKKYGLDQIKQIRLVEEIYYDDDDDSYERKEYSTELILKLYKPIRIFCYKKNR